MKRRRPCLRVALALVATIAAAGCTTAPSRADLLHRILQLPTKNLAAYHFDPSTPLVDRVGVPSDSFLRYIQKFDGAEDYAPYTPTAEERVLVRRNLDLLPRSYRQVLEARLVCIYFIDNLRSSGMTDYVLDSNEEVYAALVLNPATMRHDISDWVTYRESTAFTGESAGPEETSVKIECGHTYSGLTYVLLHEASHIVDYVEHLTPYVDPSIRSLGLNAPPTPFTTPVWRTYDVPRRRMDFPLRSRIHFYGFGRTISVSHAGEIYRSLAASPFASLYASENWAEDFAEYMTWYYLTQTLHQPYRIELFQQGRLAFEYEPMRSTRVLRRARAIQSLLSGVRTARGTVGASGPGTL